MEYFYDASEFLNRSKISDRDKEQLFEFVKELVDIYSFILDNGSKVLDESFVKKHYLFNKGLYFLYFNNNNFPNKIYYIQKIISNYILSGNYRGIDFLKKVMILEAINTCNNHLSKKVLQEKLLSVCGEKFRKEYFEYININSVNI